MFLCVHTGVLLTHSPDLDPGFKIMSRCREGVQKSIRQEVPFKRGATASSCSCGDTHVHSKHRKINRAARSTTRHGCAREWESRPTSVHQRVWKSVAQTHTLPPCASDCHYALHRDYLASLSKRVKTGSVLCSRNIPFLTLTEAH